MRLLRGSIIGMVLWAALPAVAEVSDQQVGAVVQALKEAAPQGNNGLYSPWKVTPGIIPNWSKQCIGHTLTPTQFDANPTQAQSVVSCIARRELNKQLRATGNNETASVKNFACWWMTGDSANTSCNTGATGAYVQKVLRAYKQAAMNR